jgi:hypothetical protein
MPNPTFRRWTADEIAMLKNMAKSVAPFLGTGHYSIDRPYFSRELSFALHLETVGGTIR